MQIRFYLDDDSEAGDLLQMLQNRGAEVTTTTRSGMRGAPDADHLVYAAARGYVLCTANVGDFNALHKKWMNAGRQHTGIILIAQQRYSPGEIGRRLLALRASLSAEEMVDRVEYLSNWG